MEMEEIEAQTHKFPRMSNGGNSRIIEPDDEDDGGGGGGGEVIRRSNGGGGVGRGLSISGSFGWPSSRIVRVSRTSGGKDRHSKVLTSKGLRDRRVRLSVNTAIQFYDLQDRLGYDQPSKAVEWLLKAAATSIADLPSLDPPFSDNHRTINNTENIENIDNIDDSADLDTEDQNLVMNNQLSTKSCSSTSETSKGSGLSLSRSESRIKARERARERRAEKEKEKEKENESTHTANNHHQNLNPISSSFTELLTGTSNANSHTNPNNGSNLFVKSRQWCTSTPPPMDYFGNGNILHFMNPMHHQQQTSSPLFGMTGGEHQQQQFSFVSEHFAPASATAATESNSNNNGGGGEYNLNFSISPSSSSGIAGFNNNNRGTLQSNSTSSNSPLPHHHHFQRFPASLDGSSPPQAASGFFTIAAAAAPNAASSVDHHHHLLPGFDGRLHLYYGGGGRESDQKGKGKN